jgi:3-isopropylmalate/(R)-2-methylmalate dehydratase small subunit
VLPLTLQEDRVEDLLVLLEHGADRVVAVDLQKMQVKFPDGSVHAFDINDAWRETLLKGLDPVSVAASHEDQIAAYQDRDRMTRPWVWSRSPNTKKETA